MLLFRKLYKQNRLWMWQSIESKFSFRLKWIYILKSLSNRKCIWFAIYELVTTQQWPNIRITFSKSFICMWQDGLIAQILFTNIAMIQSVIFVNNECTNMYIFAIASVTLALLPNVAAWYSFTPWRLNRRQWYTMPAFKNFYQFKLEQNSLQVYMANNCAIHQRF